MAKITGKYEVLYIIDPAQGEEGIAALVEKFKAMVEAEGTLLNIDEWGKRRMAYLINDLAEGYYVLMNMEVKPEFPAELERVMFVMLKFLKAKKTSLQLLKSRLMLSTTISIWVFIVQMNAQEQLSRFGKKQQMLFLQVFLKASASTTQSI